MPPILVWNTRGDAQNQHVWITNWAAGTVPYNTLDWAIFVESGTGSHHPNSSVVPESGGKGLDLTRFAEPYFAACATLLGMTRIAANGGVSQLRNSEITSPVGNAIPAALDVSFETNTEIARWAMRPLERFIDMAKYGGNAPIVPAGGSGGPIRKSVRNQGAANSYASSRPAWLRQARTFRESKQDIINEIQRRVNLLGHRRPHVIDSNGFKIYFWHAPQGSAGALSTVGLDDTIPQAYGSGGTLAIAANQLLSMYLGIQTWDAVHAQWRHGAFPATVAIAGDLNVRAAGISTIYGNPSVASSADDWCHVVWAAGVAMQSHTDTAATAAVPTLSDHDPVAIY
ncbi:MAG TPA: hypothetical protein VF584_16250 [Longimicrobium sp.]|jgi:hypothetical protein